jgi:hypothetical protein
MSQILIVTTSVITGGNYWLHPSYEAHEELGFFRYLENHQSDFMSEIQIVRFPDEPLNLADVRLVVNFLPDPLGRFPNFLLWASEIERRALRQGCRVINQTAALQQNTYRSVMSKIWMEKGIPCPRGRRIQTNSELLAFADEVKSPLVLKPDGTQSSQAVIRVDPGDRFDFDQFQNRVREEEINQLNAFLEDGEPTGAICASTFVDVRNEEGVVRKGRCTVFGNGCIPRHLFASKNWLVGYPIWESKSGQEEENRFLKLTEVPEADLLIRSVQALGLDVAGVDFSWDRQGKLIFWEANPYYCMTLTDQRPEEIEGIRRHHEALYRYWASLLNVQS